MANDDSSVPPPKACSLANRNCVPCRGGMPPLGGEQLQNILTQVDQWELIEDRLIERMFKFPDFVAALAFVNKVGELAEQQGHHPDIHLSWGKVKIQLQTHKINGLSESDFILAARIDQL